MEIVLLVIPVEVHPGAWCTAVVRWRDAGHFCFRIPYFFSTSKELPGKFMLSYMPRDRSVHEFVTVTHEGLRFRGQVFPTLNLLIKWFKEHFKDPIPQKLVTPSQATPRESLCKLQCYMIVGLIRCVWKILSNSLSYK